MLYLPINTSLKNQFWNNVIVNLFTLVWTSFLIDLVTFYLFLMIYYYL